ncbi:MAG: hypothetical protein KDB14_27160 [Planctomycetales bacterium]|nr:hypothetical protein [Planctomycetales bacterium]
MVALECGSSVEHGTCSFEGQRMPLRSMRSLKNFPLAASTAPRAIGIGRRGIRDIIRPVTRGDLGKVAAGFLELLARVALNAGNQT